VPIRIRRAVVRHEGGMRFDARTGTDRTLLFGDEPGLNEHSPVELITTTLAACSAMDVVSILEKKRQVLDHYAVEVEALQRDDYPQVLTRIDVLHVVEGSVVTEAAVRRAIELSATKYCPVNAMLSSGATEVHHAFRIRCTGPEPFDAEGEVVVTGPFRRPDVVS
jgi:putative redox protein